MSLTKIGSIGINTGIQFAGVTTVSTLHVGSGVTLSSDGDIFATGVTTSTTFSGNFSGGTVSGTTGTFTGDVDIADKIVHTGDTNTVIRFPSADTITAETSGTEALRIDSSGNVNFGAETANTAIQASGPFSGATPKLEIKLGGASNSYTRLINIANPSGATGSETLGRVGIKLALGNESNSTETAKAGIIYAESTSNFNNSTSLCFATSNTERVRITSDGEVKINSAASGVSANAGANEFSIEGGNIDIGMSFISPAANNRTQTIAFGDSSNTIAGRIQYAHGDDSFRFDTGGSERYRIDSAGRVLIGGTSAIIGSSDEFNEIVLTGKTRGAGITLQDVDANTRFQIRTDDAGGDPMTLMNASTNHPIAIRTNNTERLRIASGGDVTVSTGNLVIGTSGKGIDFSATSDASGSSSELLDDYEEGSFTVTASPGSGTMTFNSSYNQGTYTKIGNVVHIQAYLSVSGNSGTGDLELNSLPFTVADVADASGHVRAFSEVYLNANGGGADGNGYYLTHCLANENNTWIRIYPVNASGKRGSDISNKFSAGGDIFLQFTYFAA